ncbi:hypothetical protein HYFRA_00006214, partial [Hymenoscyphus fraxineus]
MEKSNHPTSQYFPTNTYLTPSTSSSDLEKGYALYYGDEPFPVEDASRTRFKAVRPTLEVREDGTVVLGTSFEDAVPKEFTVILPKNADKEIDGDKDGKGQGQGEKGEDVGPEDSDAFNLYSDAESKDEIDYEDSVGEDVQGTIPVAEKGKEKEKEEDSVPVNTPFFIFLHLCVLFLVAYLRFWIYIAGWLAVFKDFQRYLQKKRLTSRQNHLSQQHTLHTHLTTLSPSLPTPNTLPTLLTNPETKHKTITTELTLYSLALKARKWAHRSQALEEEMAFAQTDEGKKKDEETMKGLERQWEERKKAKKERKRVTRSAARGKGGKMGGYD